MDDFIKQQGINLTRMLKIEGITQGELANDIGVRVQTVNRWVNGHNAMRDYHAKKIMDKYPDYSRDYLQGYSCFQSEEEHARNQALCDAIDASNKIADIEEIINRHCLCSIELLNDEEMASYCEENPDDYSFLVVDDGAFVPFEGDFPRVRVSRKGLELIVKDSDWISFVDEVTSYIDMRLNLALDRGYW